MKLTAMQIAEAKKCKSPEELVEKAKERGFEITLDEAKEVLASPGIVELDDDDLAAVSGGCKTADHVESVHCNNCGGRATYSFTAPLTKHDYFYDCSCGYRTIYIGDEWQKCFKLKR